MAKKIGISIDDVVRAAAEIADRSGLENLTLAKVAELLGARSPSLYAHVDGLPGLRRELQLHAARELNSAFEDSVGALEGRDALQAIARTYRRFAIHHPGLFASLLPSPKPGEDDEVYNALAEPAMLVAGIVAGSGVSDEEAIPVVRAIRSAIHGFVVLEMTGGFGMPYDIDESFETTIELVIGDLFGQVPTPPAT